MRRQPARAALIAFKQIIGLLSCGTCRAFGSLVPCDGDIDNDDNNGNDHGRRRPAERDVHRRAACGSVGARREGFPAAEMSARLRRARASRIIFRVRSSRAKAPISAERPYSAGFTRIASKK